MDPVTAFSLAAGVLQVVDLSFKVLSKCKEIYEDGSLAQHRDVKTAAEYLAETTKRLEKRVQSASKPVSQEAKDVIEVSKECSVTATALLSELQELQLKPGSSLSQALKKTTRAVRRKSIIIETEKKLERYQSILNTRVLSKLDAHAIQQIEQFETLDQSIRSLATALSQGCNTVAQLLTDQTVIIQEHIDRRFDDQAYVETIQRAQQQFKDSLFFPEIFARQDDIAKSHEGTCRWIFDSPQAISSHDSTGGKGTRGTTSHPWSNFTEWLRKDDDTYWLSGKPGSGKSTLMKYITSEFRDFCDTGAASHGLGPGSQLVMCSFFFWALGSPMQKNYVGFLRSLLYQLFEQREDLIPLIMGQVAISGARTSHPCEHLRIHAWTKERLEDILRRFLREKPSSMSVCLFIDGLDEFAGDEDLLMQSIRLLNQTPRTHVCVSSRPEQIFRQGFAKSPSLRLQDLNYEDIKKATKDRLDMTLRERYPQESWATYELVENVIGKAQGIFLWADLVTKDLKKGARNSDSVEELRQRLDRTPNTIEGLYEHMLERLDKPYLQDAARYFQLITANQGFLALEKEKVEQRRTWRPVLTLLGCACADEKAWNHVLSHDIGHFQSPGFQDLCCSLETRILTRCAGLVEISEHRQGFLAGIFGTRDKNKLGAIRTNWGAQNLSKNLRKIKFIHKTVMDFLQSHKEFFQNQDWRLTATLSILRGALGAMSLSPTMMFEEDASLRPFIIDEEEILILLSRPSWIEALWPAPFDCQAISDNNIEFVDQAYKVLDHVNECLNGLDYPLSSCLGSRKKDNFSFHNRLCFAAYFGRYGNVSRYTAQTSPTGKDAEYVLSCTFSGLSSLVNNSFSIRETCVVMEGFFRIVIDYLLQSRELRSYVESKWVTFLNCSNGPIKNLISARSPLGSGSINPRFLQQAQQSIILKSIILWTDAVAIFLRHNADSNIMLGGQLQIYHMDKDGTGHRIGVIIRAAEAILTWVRRNFGAVDPAIREELETLLQSHGGQHRKTILSLSLGYGPDLRLTQEQSDRLLPACSSEDGSFLEAGSVEWSTVVDKEDQEPVIEDPTTERTLKQVLEYIDRWKSDRNTRIRASSIPP